MNRLQPKALARPEFHPEHLNTPRLVADATGTTVWRWDQQEPFGNNPADENPSGLGTFDLPLRLPGQVHDKETALHYNYYRDYDPGLGIYKQSDLIGLRGGLNTYSYGGGNPISITDHYGLKSTCPCNQSFIDCLANCIQAYDPFNAVGKTTLTALGGPIPKALFNLPKIGSPYLSLPSLLGLGQGTAVSGANVLRLIGRGSSAAFLIYGNYLFAVEVMCTAQCVGDSCAY